MTGKLQNYIQCMPGYFWVLEDDGEVIAGSNNRGTIVYTDLLLQTLEFIQPHGWPPFGALLLAFAATNANSNISGLVEEVREACSRMAQGHRKEPAYVKEAEPLLHLLQKLPANCRSGVARMQLMQVLFCKSHNRSGAERVTQWLPMLRKEGFHTDPLPAYSTDKQRQLFFQKVDKDFQCLGLLAQRFRNEESILEALARLPVVPEPELPELSVAGDAVEPTDWLEALLHHPETFEAGALLKHLWAGLSVPVLFSQPEEQLAGGAADLTNKGSFERMLLSEYANEDLVLLSRLANNEVLYLHPEVSHANDDAERTVLIDVSLKNWGNCRVLAYALALAIAKHPRIKEVIQVQAVGQHTVPVAYSNVQEVIASMRQLDTGLHAAAGISAFLASQPAGKKQQLLFISSEEAAAHTEVQKVISDHYHSFVCWIMVTASGDVAVYRKVQNSRKLQQQMTLPLDTLWQKKPLAQPASPPPVVPLSDEPVSIATFPILCPADNNIKKLMGKEGDYWIVTGNKQLFHACDYKDKRGWEWMPWQLPEGSSLFDMCVNQQGQNILLCFVAQGKKVGLLNVHTGNCDMLDFPEWQLSSHPQFFHMEYTFHYMKERDFWTIYSEQPPHIHHYTGPRAIMVEHYNNYEKHLAELSDAFNKAGAKPWIKKLKSLYINTEGQLVLNDSHVLVLNNRGVMKWLLVREERRRFAVAASYYESENLFRFSNGSRVVISDKGFIMLKMVKPDVEESYDVIAPPQHIESKIDYVRQYSENGNINRELRDALHLIGDKHRVLATFPSHAQAVAYTSHFVKTGLALEIAKVQHVEEVYIPLVMDTGLAIATKHYFAGNYYYLPYNYQSVVVRDSADLYKRTVDYFISQIIHHGA